jgi:NAD(P)-dependent dehydrogenase (short-subunit alcohol dehydrogenase family)
VSGRSGRLQGHHVAVTGGSRGIGAAIVEKALAEGAQVSVADLDEVPGLELVNALGAGERAFVAAADVRVAAEIEAFHQAAVARFGPVTGLVNNAGRNAAHDPVTMTEAEWDDVLAVDLKSAWLCARTVLPGMMARGGGSIVNIASVHADQTYPGYFPYAVAKSGLVGLTRTLALEVGPKGVRVNALSPGWTETRLVAEYLATQPPETRRRVIEAHPLGRIGTPMEVANCAVFLLSDEASFVTGANWRVDGGNGARFAG